LAVGVRCLRATPDGTCARRIVGKKQRRAGSKTLLAIAGLTEQEMTDLIRAAGADPERISPESQDFPSWHLHRPLEASDQQQSQLYWLAGANAMIRIALTRKRQVAALES